MTKFALRFVVVGCLALALLPPFGGVSSALPSPLPSTWVCGGVDFADVLPGDTNRDGTPITVSPDGRGKWVPVIFVHGWTSRATHDSARRGAFSKLIDLTSVRGTSVESQRSLIGQLQTVPGVAPFTFDYHDLSGRWVTDPGIGPLLGSAIDCLYEKSGGEKVIVVAHSMGGLATRYALGADSARPTKVSSAITFGTPNTGSLLASLSASATDTIALSSSTVATVRLLLAACAQATTASMNASGVCADGLGPAGPFYGQAGVALRTGSKELAALAPWPKSIDVRAMAGDARFDITERNWFGIPLKTSQAEPGDIVVTRQSATAGAAASRSVKCGYQLNPSQGTRDGFSLALEVVPISDVPDLPGNVSAGACFHENLMRSIELTNEATGIIDDDIIARLGAGPPTTVIDEVPVQASGNPATGYSVVGDSGSVDCGYPSTAAVDDNIQTCAPTAAGADICYPTGASTLLCADDPWDRELRNATSSEPLTAVTADVAPRPWALELADGTRCRVRNGGAWGGRADDLRGAYGCDNGGSSFILTEYDQPPVDTSSDVWTVKVGPLGEPDQDFPPPIITAVRTAWFAATG